MKRRTILILWSVITVTLMLSIVGATYAWYQSYGKSTDNPLQMGVVDIDAKNYENNFSLLNNILDVNFENISDSNIDYFLQLPITVVFIDEVSKEELPVNTPDNLINKVSISNLTVNASPVPFGNAGMVYTEHVSQGYKKIGIDMLDAGGKYIVFPATVFNAGTITYDSSVVKGMLKVELDNTLLQECAIEAKALADSGNALISIRIVPEAMQATKKAVLHASSLGYPWDGAKVLNEASTIVPDSTIH